MATPNHKVLTETWLLFLNAHTAIPALLGIYPKHHVSHAVRKYSFAKYVVHTMHSISNTPFEAQESLSIYLLGCVDHMH